MGILARLDEFFGRFDRPWLAALGTAGLVWFSVGLLLALVAAGIHPLFDMAILVVHGLGIATLVVAGLIYALFFWNEYFHTKFGG